MHKWILGAVLLLGGSLVWAQRTGELDPNIQVSDAAAEAPSSSVDLLRQSAQKQSPFAAPASNKPPRIPRAPVKTSTETVAVPAVPAQARSTAPAASNNTLDMPLPLGGATTSVQTAVAPAAVPKKNSTLKNGKTRPKTVSSATVSTVVSTQPATNVSPAENEEEDAAEAELEYAVKMLEKSREEAQTGRTVPPPAAKNLPSKVPAANKAFNPNAFRPGVEWVASKSTHFDIYTQKPNGTIGSSNMALAFESAYDTLRRFIPWMMAGKVKVFIYQDHNSYLRYEPEAKAWTRAIAYPTRGEIAVYDEPGKMQELKEVFAHELTHIFTQQFFDKHQTGRIMTPTWLDEGLAVLVEDQMFAGKQRGGPWDQDYRTLRFERDPKTMVATFGSNSMFGGGYQPKPFVPVSQRGGVRGPRQGKPVRLIPFEDFMQEGSLETAEGKGNVQNWYLQAYLMVRFLLNPAGGSSPSNRMQFEQLTRLIADGEAVRNPSTGFLMKDSRGKQVYEPYSAEKALGKSYRYGNTSSFEDAFWRWLNK